MICFAMSGMDVKLFSIIRQHILSVLLDLEAKWMATAPPVSKCKIRQIHIYNISDAYLRSVQRPKFFEYLCPAYGANSWALLVRLCTNLIRKVFLPKDRSLCTLKERDWHWHACRNFWHLLVCGQYSQHSHEGIVLLGVVGDFVGVWRIREAFSSLNSWTWYSQKVTRQCLGLPRIFENWRVSLDNTRPYRQHGRRYLNQTESSGIQCNSSYGFVNYQQPKNTGVRPLANRRNSKWRSR